MIAANFLTEVSWLAALCLLEIENTNLHPDWERLHTTLQPSSLQEKSNLEKKNVPDIFILKTFDQIRSKVSAELIDFLL